MTTMDFRDLAGSSGRTVRTYSGEAVGEVFDIYADEQTGRPEWLAVSTGAAVTFVPVDGAERQGDEILIPYDQATIDSAPATDADGVLTVEEEDELYRHYGRQYSDASSGRGLPATEDAPVDDAMTRSEEELRVAKASAERGRVRLRKWIETEQATVTVPIAREEVRVEREPITEANIDQAMSGPEISEAEHEVVLHEEQPVVAKETVPKERVRLEKEVVTDEEVVGAELRKERVALDDDELGGPRSV